MKLNHSSLLFIGGFLWLVVGAILFPFGLQLILSGLKPQTIGNELSTPMLQFFISLGKGKENGAILLITLSMFVGYMKGKYVLAKSARRIVNRVLTLPNPTHITNLYNLPFYLLIISMMGLGMLMKWFVPVDVRGFVDVAVGSALINGAMIYLRAAIQLWKKSPTAA